MLGSCFLPTGQWPGFLQWEVAAPRARWPASRPLRALGTCPHSPGGDCRAGSRDSPTSCSDRALGTRRPPVGVGPRQVTQGPAALALVLLHSWNLRCPIGMLTAMAMGLCAPGGRVGSLSPSSAPGGKRIKSTHPLDFFPQPVLSSRGSKASPAHFLQEACVLAPHPQTLPQPRFLWDPGSGGLDPLHRSCCTMPGR